MSDVKIKDSSIHETLRKKKRRRRKKQRDPFDIPGVRKIVLSELAQKIIGCRAGEDVNAERPWKYVAKEIILDNIELHEESSEFLAIKNDILAFPGNEFLIGYIPDEGRSYDEFYICLTQEATNAVNAIIEKQKAEQEIRLYNTINKTVREWITQGSEAEVDESIPKKNRALIEVEIESQYPIYPIKMEFDTVKAEERRDGYMELRCSDIIQNVCKKRIDASVQVTAQNVTMEAQTICTYPSNTATQYQYEVENTQELFEKCKKYIEEYTGKNVECIEDFLHVNGAINLYTNDYKSIDGEKKLVKTGTIEEVKEYISFMDVTLCKGKMISDACWHPMWTGTVAVSYVDIAPTIYRTGPNTDDYVLKAVHGINPVLIWCTNDTLKPKLILPSPRPVRKLSFCDHDENILIGGCSNGQIIIWDIRQKLDKAETIDILTPAQQKYKNYMYSMLGWMKNVEDVSLVRPAAVSDLRYSPKGPISGITWMSPLYELSKSGNLREIPEEENKHSLQFLATSEDGTISIWDLQKKPIFQPGGFKQRKLRRLKKKPSALTMEESPHKVLHLNFKPMCNIKLHDKESSSKKLLPITSMFANYCNLQYIPKVSEKGEMPPFCEDEYCTDSPSEKSMQKIKKKMKKYDITERVIYLPIFDREYSHSKPVEPKIRLGTVKGDYIHLQWEGLDFDSGEIVNTVDGKQITMARYHDGPVNTVSCSKIEEFTLTVGGKTFALWHKDLPNRPLLWRKNKHLYTTSEWNLFEPYSFTNKVVNGDVETWIVSVSTKTPVYTMTFSSSFLTASALNPLNVRKYVYGAGDKQGTFRLYYLAKNVTVGTIEEKIEKCRNFMFSEIERKKNFLAWQEMWNKNNASLLKAREEEMKVIAEKEAEAQKKRVAEQTEEKAGEKALAKGPQPGKFVEWVMEQRHLQEAERIRNTVIAKKQLDTKELERRRKPLQKLDEENERKKRKQKQRLKDADIIFKDTVASLFPDIGKKKPKPLPDPYAGGDEMSENAKRYKDYLELANEAEEFVENNSYKYRFNWKQVLDNGKKRRNLMYGNLHPSRQSKGSATSEILKKEIDLEVINELQPINEVQPDEI